jgi:hypothetical protein
MTAGPDPREISLMLADDIEKVVGALGIVIQRRDRRRLTCLSPWNGKPKLEVEIYPRPGKWNDWIEGRWGDALGLVACIVAGVADPKDRRALGQAMAWSREYFGLEAGGFDHDAWARRRAEAEARAARAAKAAARELADARKTAHGLWLAAEVLTPGDVGWQYLQARGVDLARFAHQPRAVRLSLAAPWYDGGDAPSYVGPALMSAMTLPDGRPGALHRTWIDPARPGEKAAITPNRKMWPDSQGAAIRLWRGETGLTEREATDRGVVEDLVVCEGVEDGLSVALCVPELRVVAAGSLPGMLAYTPPKHIRRVIVAADNDWGKPQAAALLDRACARFHELGKLVSIARSPEGKDFNDLLRGV